MSVGNIQLGKLYSNPYARAFKPQSVVEVDGGDHEVGMAQGQLDYIIKSANELKQKLGVGEKNIPGWIQDHISKAHSYLHQANSGHHELGESKKSMKLTSLLSEGADYEGKKFKLGTPAVYKDGGREYSGEVVMAPSNQRVQLAGRWVMIGKGSMKGIQLYGSDTFIVPDDWNDVKPFKGEVNEAKTYKKGDKLKIKLPNGKKFDVVFDMYSSIKGVALGKFKDGSGEYTIKPFNLDTIVEVVTEEDKSAEEILKGLRDMAMGDLERIEDYAEMIADRMEQGQELSSWMYSQITLAVDQLNAVHDAMDGKDGVKESELKGYLAADVIDDIVKTIGSKFVKGHVENAPNKNYIYLKLTDIKFGSGVVKMLKSQFGIDAKIDKTFGNIPTVSFPSNKVISEVLTEDADMNKDVKKFLDKSLRGTKAGSPPHLFAVKHTLIGALRDANFHSDAKKVPALFPKAEFEPKTYGENEEEAIDMYEYEIGPQIARICGYDGKAIVSALGFYVSMTIGRPVGEKVQKLVEMMKEGSADGGKMAKTHVVYAINVQLKDGSYASPLRVAVNKGADAEARAKMLAKKHIGKDFKSITAIGKALNPEKHTIKEDIEPQTKKIASLTGTRADAVQQFVSTHGLNITKLVKFIEKGKLSDRMDFVSAIAGKPNNPIQKKIIKMFSEAVNEATEPQIITQLRDIVKNQQYKMIKDPKTGKSLRVDMQTANVILKVYDALGTQNKEKFFNSGLVGMQSTAFKLMR